MQNITYEQFEQMIKANPPESQRNLCNFYELHEFVPPVWILDMRNKYSISDHKDAVAEETNLTHEEFMTRFDTVRPDFKMGFLKTQKNVPQEWIEEAKLKYSLMKDSFPTDEQLVASQNKVANFFSNGPCNFEGCEELRGHYQKELNALGGVNCQGCQKGALNSKYINIISAQESKS